MRIVHISKLVRELDPGIYIGYTVDSYFDRVRDLRLGEFNELHVLWVFVSDKLRDNETK